MENRNGSPPKEVLAVGMAIDSLKGVIFHLLSKSVQSGLIFTKSKSLQNQRDLHKLQVLTLTLIFTAFSKAKSNFLGATSSLPNSRPEKLSGML